ncbi:ribonuclease H-like domain-containing protein [Phyllosticta paracitricarpa]|uniref:RNA exonuclease 4 n=2 Tax=Phyllosticta TaxID=121621 RepID=A0ABR1M814_9PEZI
MILAMELKNLSSNWKKLQQKIKTDDTTKSSSLKRKSTNEQPSATNDAKRKKINSASHPADTKRRKMGSLLSKETASSDTPSSNAPTSASAFAQEHNIPLADVEAAYNLSKTTTNGSNTTYLDEPNAGLNTTRQPGKYLALDCEMVGVGPDPDSDSQLARVSIVDYNGHQLYDSYVLPVLPVTDYRTHVSGITPRNLAQGRPFNAVQREVAKLLQGRILVGHALKHDMGVLQLSHPRRDIRDTARHPAFRARSMGRAPALRKLAKEVLGLEIQSGEHSSVEDARATMALFRADKEAFEREHAKRWGRSSGPTAVAARDDVDAAAGKPKKGKSNKKKKKRGKK